MKKQSIMICICLVIIVFLISLLALIIIKPTKNNVVDSLNTTDTVSVPTTSKKYETIFNDNKKNLKYCLDDFCIQINRMSYEGVQGECDFSVNGELLGNNYIFYFIVNGNNVQRNMYIDSDMINSNNLFFQFSDKELLNATDFYFEIA